MLFNTNYETTTKYLHFNRTMAFFASKLLFYYKVHLCCTIQGLIKPNTLRMGQRSDSSLTKLLHNLIVNEDTLLCANGMRAFKVVMM